MRLFPIEECMTHRYGIKERITGHRVSHAEILVEVIELINPGVGNFLQFQTEGIELVRRIVNTVFFIHVFTIALKKLPGQGSFHYCSSRPENSGSSSSGIRWPVFSTG